MTWFRWIMLALAAGLFGLFAYQLSQPKDEFVHSAMIGETIPPFDLPPAVADRPGLSSANLADGQPKLLNVFASWCVPCAAEAPNLARLEAAGAKKTWPYPLEAPFAVHLLGTCRMGNDPRTSVVDKFHRSHDVANLFVSDGSQFTTGAAENPTLTIVALALRQADHIAGAMSRAAASSK